MSNGLKKMMSFFLSISIVLILLPIPNASAHSPVMTVEEFIGYLQYVANRTDTAYKSGDVWSIGKYSEGKIHFDCWGLGESIICSRGQIVYNTDPALNPWDYFFDDDNGGCYSCTGSTVMDLCPNKSDDFSNLIPGEWLYLRGADFGWESDHMGYYIGSGQVIECTPAWGANGVTYSQTDSNGSRTQNGQSVGKWTYHGMVPWIDYTPPHPYLDNCTPYPCSDFFEITSNGAYLKSLPCSYDTNHDSTNVVPSPLTVGTTLRASRMYLNNQGNYWYATIYEGKFGYIYKGDTKVVHAPESCLDGAEGRDGTIWVHGWSFDRDELWSSVPIHIYVGGPAGSGANHYEISANTFRDDVNGVYGVGDYHGFNEIINVRERGTQTLYFYAGDIGGGPGNQQFGTATVTISKTETIPPTISDVSVYNITSTSYTILAKVTDEDGYVKEVKMPSWAYGASTDGIEWPNAAQNDCMFMYTVTRNPGQHWVTDIYAYDMENNCTVDNGTNVAVTVRDCVVSFDANDGNVNESNRTVYSVLINGVQQNSYGALPTPTRDGYSFDGWYSELTGGEKITAYSKVSDIDAQTLYARWSSMCEHSYTILDFVVNKCKSPTLNEGGYYTYRCNKCGEEVVEYYPALNETDYEFERFESTCTETGYDSYTYLGDDAEHLSFTIDLPLAAHQYESVNVPPVAGKAGYTMHICSVCGESYKEYYSDNWTEWSEAYPSGVDASLIESKTQYRAKTRETTTSSSSSMDGWTLYDTQQAWGAYGEWNEWGDTAITSDDSTVVETRTVYPYYYFYCTNCGPGARYPYSGVRCEICGRSDTVLGSTGTVEWYTNPWSDSIAWGTGTGKYYQYIDGSILWNWEDGAPKTQYRSRVREMETTYHFYRWTEWSEWGDQVETETDDKEVETRTVYRYAIIPSEYPNNLIIIPAGTSVLQEESFYGINAEYVYVPASVSEIKSLAFAACPNLKVVYFESGNNIAVAENFVSGCNRMLVIDAPEGSSVANNISTYRQYLNSTNG